MQLAQAQALLQEMVGSGLDLPSSLVLDHPSARGILEAVEEAERRRNPPPLQTPAAPGPLRRHASKRARRSMLLRAEPGRARDNLLQEFGATCFASPSPHSPRSEPELPTPVRPPEVEPEQPPPLQLQEAVAARPPPAAPPGLPPPVTLRDVAGEAAGFIPFVSQEKMLGSILSSDMSDATEVEARIEAATKAFARLRKPVLGRRDVSYETKRLVYEALVMSLLLFGCENWALDGKMLGELESFHGNCIRQMCKVSRFHMRFQHISFESLRQKIGLAMIRKYIDRRKLRWLGHVSRMGSLTPGEPRTVGMPRLPFLFLGATLASKRPPHSNPFTLTKDISNTLARAGLVDKSAPSGLGVPAWRELASNRTEWRRIVRAGGTFGIRQGQAAARVSPVPSPAASHRPSPVAASPPPPPPGTLGPPSGASSADGSHSAPSSPPSSASSGPRRPRQVRAREVDRQAAAYAASLRDNQVTRAERRERRCVARELWLAREGEGA